MRSFGIGAAVVSWLALLILGFWQLYLYEHRAGRDQGVVPSRWPAESSLALDDRRFTLLVFVHPRCPCSRATLHELSRLLARVESQVLVTVVFSYPDDVPPDWERSDLWNIATNTTGVAVVRDRGGHEAQRFGAGTSGDVTMYSANGDLWFSGGITGSRGHEGDNFGSAAIAGLLQGELTPPLSAPVFGCCLTNQRTGSAPEER